LEGTKKDRKKNSTFRRLGQKKREEEKSAKVNISEETSFFWGGSTNTGGMFKTGTVLKGRKWGETWRPKYGVIVAEKGRNAQGKGNERG